MVSTTFSQIVIRMHAYMLLRNIIEWLCVVFVYGCFCLFVCLFVCLLFFENNKITIWIRQEIRSTEGYCQMRLLSEYRQNFQTSMSYM